MNARFTILLLLLYGLFHTPYLQGQVKTKIFSTEVPATYFPEGGISERMINVQLPAAFREMKEAVTAKKYMGKENQFALPVYQEVDVLKEAAVVTRQNYTIYSLSIQAEGAVNLSVQFSQFKLPEGAVLTIYTKKEITDSITSRENNERHTWATRVYHGERLNFILKMPVNAIELGALTIHKINAGYTSGGFDFGNIGLSAACHVNVNCPAGTGWDPEKNAVGMTVADGVEFCSGSLIMNTCNTDIPYFLTANHCLEPGNFNSWVFQFQTWSTDCSTNTGWIETVQYNGSQLRANSATTDFALMELNTRPTSGSGLHYAGWSRNTTDITSTTVIHHPAGDLMKISRDNDAPTPITDVTDVARFVWQIDQDLGKLEGGSSGGPYFNQDHRIIGQHFRRPNSNLFPVCDLTVGYGGRFDLSWTGGGTSATRLSDWLDPSGTGAMTTNTTNVSSLNAITYSISGSAFICAAENYSVTSSMPVTWSVAPAGIVSLSVSGGVATLTKITDGYVTLTASTNSGCSPAYNSSKAIMVGNPPPQGICGPDFDLCHERVGPYASDIATVCSPAPYPGVTYQWQIDSDPIATATSVTVYGYRYSLGWHPIKVRSYACGVYSSWTESAFLVVNCSEPGGRSFVVSPNPANDVINIVPSNSSQVVSTTTDSRGQQVQKSPALIKEVRVYDYLGILKRVQSYDRVSQARIPLNGLTTGNYVVEIIHADNTKEKHKLFVNK